jgi:hypothetical protein
MPELMNRFRTASFWEKRAPVFSRLILSRNPEIL